MSTGRHGRDPAKRGSRDVTEIVRGLESLVRGLVAGLAGRRRTPPAEDWTAPGARGPYGLPGAPGPPGISRPPEAFGAHGTYDVAEPHDAIPGEHGSVALTARAASRWAWRHRVVLGVTGVAVLVVSYAVPAAASVGRLPAGVRVAGVDIGGLAHADARARLSRQLAGLAARPVEVVAGDRAFTFEPAELGLSFDANATVAAADDGMPTPSALLRSLFGSRDVAPRARVDHGRLAQAVATVADAVDRPKREGAVRYTGTRPVPVLPKPGRVVDRAAAARLISTRYLGSAAQPLRVPTRADVPTVTAAEARKVAAAAARTAVGAAVTLTNGERQAVLSRAALATHLRFVADGRGGLRPRFDADAATGQAFAGKLIDKAVAPRDATFEIVDARPRLVPARTGQGIDTARLATAVAAVVGDPSRNARAARAVPIQPRTTPPRVTTEQARGYGITEKISTFTTRHACCAPRVTNIHRIADLLDGYLVRPGETFSLNGVIGERDKARGFVAAPQILNGRFVDDVGGGVSQFTTTMFNAVFFAGLQDVQHTPHQFYISRYPAGRESTVSFPQPDFRWRNDSPHGVLIKTAHTGTSITVSFWSTARFEIESKSSDPYQVRPFENARDSGRECIPMEGAKGFAIDVWRIFKQDGAVVRRQRFHTVYQPEPRLTCESKS